VTVSFTNHVLSILSDANAHPQISSDLSCSRFKRIWPETELAPLGSTMNSQMAVASPTSLTDVSRRVLRLQVFTILWMALEASISLGAAWRSRSPAMFAFGGDSLMEMLSAGVLFWRFRFELNEARAARIAGVLLFALAGLVMLTSVLNFLGYREAQRSLVGIGILLAAAVVMPSLANRKWKLAVITSRAALKADATESALCGYMALIAVAGLAVNAIWGKSLADPLAALALTPLIVREGWEAIRSAKLGCECSHR
jgi:divalent metal cation (Fe/Co/Zn/Cd) transporter